MSNHHTATLTSATPVMVGHCFDAGDPREPVFIDENRPCGYPVDGGFHVDARCECGETATFRTRDDGTVALILIEHARDCGWLLTVTSGKVC